jgi:hypothetical protein
MTSETVTSPQCLNYELYRLHLSVHFLTGFIFKEESNILVLPLASQTSVRFRFPRNFQLVSTTSSSNSPYIKFCSNLQTIRNNAWLFLFFLFKIAATKYLTCGYRELEGNYLVVAAKLDNASELYSKS